MDGGDHLDLSFLDSLLPNEFVPVDSFWPTYVDELSSRSKRQVEQGPADPDPKHFCSGLSPLQGPSTLAALPQQLGQQLQIQQAQQGLPAIGPGAPFLAAGAGAAGLLPGPFLPGGLGRPADAFAPAAGLLQGQCSGSGGLWGEAEGGSHSDEPSPSQQQQAQEEQGAPKRRISKKKQESNKAAQQRYRERKKAQFQEMEEKLEVLTQQLQRMEALEGRNRLLEAQNTDLGARLVEREREIERLKLTLDRYSDESLQGQQQSQQRQQQVMEAGAGTRVGGASLAAGAAGCAPAGAGDGGEGGAPSSACVPLPSDLAAGEAGLLPMELSGQVKRLHEFLAAHEAELEKEASGAAMPSPLLKELVSLVARACQLCQAAIRADGVQVLDLMDRDPQALSMAQGEAEALRMNRLLRRLRLTGGQAEQLLLLREAHLGRMRGIYEERQGLNMQAMALMLPHTGPRNGVPYDDGTVEGRMAATASAGYLAVARGSIELGKVLDKIKDNLRREQHAVMQMNCTTITRILSPVQAAHYMVESYPRHCDALTLSNVLAAERAQQGTGAAMSKA